MWLRLTAGLAGLGFLQLRWLTGAPGCLSSSSLTQACSHKGWTGFQENKTGTASWVCVCAQSLSHVWLFVIPWTAAHQVPLSMGSFIQEYGSGLPFPSLGDPPDPGIKSMSLVLASGFFTTEPNVSWDLGLDVTQHALSEFHGSKQITSPVRFKGWVNWFSPLMGWLAKSNCKGMRVGEVSNSHHFPQTDCNFSICFPVMTKICISVESVKVLNAWSCLTLCDPVDWGLPSSCVHRLLQARILEWVAIDFSSGSSRPRDRAHPIHEVQRLWLTYRTRFCWESWNQSE